MCESYQVAFRKNKLQQEGSFQPSLRNVCVSHSHTHTCCSTFWVKVWSSLPIFLSQNYEPQKRWAGNRSTNHAHTKTKVRRHASQKYRWVCVQVSKIPWGSGGLADGQNRGKWKRRAFVDRRHSIPGRELLPSRYVVRVNRSDSWHRQLPSLTQSYPAETQFCRYW